MIRLNVHFILNADFKLLTGNMWAQTWDNLAKELQPYPDAARVDVTTPLVEQVKILYSKVEASLFA